MWPQQVYNIEVKRLHEEGISVDHVHQSHLYI